MADGLLYTPGAGATVATDDCGVPGHVQIFKLAISTDGSATLVPAEATNGLDVDVTRVIPGTAATHLGKAEDAAHSTGDTGVMALAVRKDTAAALSGTDGDYEPLQVTGGKLWIAGAYPEDSGHTSTEVGLHVMGVRDDSPADANAGTEGDYASLLVNGQGALWVTPTPTHKGGAKIFRSLDLDETEEEVSATLCVLYGWFITNLSASTRFVKFYNATAANVIVGTTAPVLTVPLEADQAAVVEFSLGIGFDTALTVAATTGVADADTGAPGANDVVVNIFYKNAG